MSTTLNRRHTNGIRYPQWLRRLLPFLDWIHELRDGKTLRADLFAGVTVALVLVPQSMAYAQLAGLPAYYGLYTAFLPPIVAALFGSSRQLATGPVAVVSLLTAAALEPIAASGSAGYVAYAITLSLLVGLFQLALGLLRLGVMVNFLSHPVILGFTNAAAIIIATSQLSKVFGVRVDRAAHHYETVWNTLVAIAHDVHWPTLVMALAGFAVMFALKRAAPRAPNVLIAVALSGVVSWLIGFETMGGGAVVGSIPQGLPSLTLPAFSFEVMQQLLSAAITIALIGFIEAISIAKAMAARTRHRLDANQELIGQGLANVVGSLSQSYPTSGSFSRSAVNFGAGAVTGLSSVVTGALVVVTLLWLTPLLYHVPQATLAAVIMLAVAGLINVKGVTHAWRANRQDGIVAITSFALTLAFAPHIDNGILVGAALALVLYLFRTMRPRVAVVARHADGTLRDAEVFGLQTCDEIAMIRFDGSLYFANTVYFEDKVLERVALKPELKFVIVIGDGINQVDATGEEMLAHLAKRLRTVGIEVLFSGLKKQVMDVLERTGLCDRLGADAFFRTEEQALEYAWKKLGEGHEVDCPLNVVCLIKS